MPGRAHETLVDALHDRPTLLAALVYALTGHTIPPEMRPVDSTIRFVKVDEVRPDILYESAPGWTITEVQNDIDPEKQRRWLLAAAVLFNQTGVLGSRGILATAEERATIEGCSDPAVLDRWFLRAVTAGSVAEILGTNEKAQAAAKPKAAKPHAAKPRAPKQRAGA